VLGLALLAALVAQNDPAVRKKFVERVRPSGQ